MEISVSSIDIINWIVDIDNNLDSIFYLYRVSYRNVDSTYIEYLYRDIYMEIARTI